MIDYVTHDGAGNLTGAFCQDPHHDHVGLLIECTPDERSNWLAYRAVQVERQIGEKVIPPAEGAPEGTEPTIEPIMGMVWELELKPAPEFDLAAAKAKCNDAINAWRLHANFSHFTHGGKQIACDQLSRSDLDAVANSIGLTGEFPEGWPGGWKAMDNTILPLATIEAFKSLYASMTAQGTANFGQAQAWKAQLAAAEDEADIAAIYEAMEAA
ncbi:DUF4376 domain-containing protein [Massilia sp. TS11]|uniref:DUF4376 domain-containing protein n=1 Tax=Massilia sp. TS11 TaxID=2908003 RepID=UPI001EDC4B24|nr:DUF4376 domain-containing protein [Massilia sp. TS11]MCG2585519.1 DUF4376 domain-containing protein [Massilia sp. TS11]